ncbi:endonuclease III; DNA-(apurinic or apyrimidinic site) lyase [Thermaerobacter marianensis DSM 12885]|uniref:Endonuclease III n=1 Tax=Thermaerobacter marianensis (strain ATCC 700841 / DSM 12885 / JCM 10246 / 7p75a) TaxID=644966 RepID=E6SII5_THEM7|nr:endonuclease III; DNA-(apurinic or apyrimidinic site) lyase [Thermaerobacter marianensis DSM 12885]
MPPEERRRIARIRATLARMYPDATTALNWRTPFELLVATILSAQTTDAAVNQVTPALFARCPTPAAMLELTEDELGAMIRTIGLWRNKARNLLAACRILVERHGGQVPRTREELVQLPGVGRKTANVVLSNAFGIPAIAVDTHVFRVARRLGLASGTTPERVEQELMEKIPEAEWSRAHHWLIWHGRRICHARNPRCDLCALRPDCPTGQARLAAGNGDGTGPAEAAATGTPPGAPDQPVASGGRRPAAGGWRAVKPRGGPARDGHGPAAN